MFNCNYCSELAWFECSIDRFCKKHKYDHCERHKDYHSYQDIYCTLSSDQKFELQNEISSRILLYKVVKCDISMQVKKFIRKIQFMLAENIKRIDHLVKSYMKLLLKKQYNPKDITQIELILKSRLIRKNVAPIDDSALKFYFEQDLIIEFDRPKQLESFIKNYSTEASCIKLTYDHNYAAVGYLDHSIKVWDLNKMGLHKLLLGHQMQVTCIDFHANNELIVSGSLDATIIIWNMANGQKIRTIEQHTDPVNQVAIMNDKRFIISSSYAGKFLVYDLHYGVAAPFISNLKISSFALFNSTIVLGLIDLNLALVEIISENIKTQKKVEKKITCIAGSPELNIIISGHSDGEVLIWDPFLNNKFYKIADLQSDVITISAKLNAIACWTRKDITIIDSAKFYTKARFNTNGLVIGELYKEDKIIVVVEEIEVRSFNDDRKISCISSLYYQPNQFLVSPDLKFISVVLSQEVHVWDLYNGELFYCINDESVNCIAFSQDSNSLVTGGAIIKVYDIYKRSLIFKSEDAIGINCLALSDIFCIAVGCHSETIQLWKDSKFQQLRKLNYCASALAFTHDRNYLAYIFLDEFAIIEIESKRTVYKHNDSFYSDCIIIISEDDKYYALQNSKSLYSDIFHVDSKSFCKYLTKTIWHGSNKKFTLGLIQLLYESNYE